MLCEAFNCQVSRKILPTLYLTHRTMLACIGI